MNTTDNPGVPEPQRKRPRRPGLDELFDTIQQVAPTLVKLRTNSAGMKLVLLPEGSFAMGSPDSQMNHRLNEAPVHEVLLTQSFYIGVHPVTQQQYQEVMQRNPACFHRGNGGELDHPVENVSWEDAVLFCEKLSESQSERVDGLKYRLPTEAEWEFACRAGKTSVFGMGDTLTSLQANFDGNYPYGENRRGPFLEKTSRVGSYPANNFGLYDMHGNVWEWCADWYDGSYYARSTPRDPQGPADGQMRVVRGGCWRNQASVCRSAYRNALVPYNRDPYTGFRVVAVPAVR
jgi:formylglycine-generating enzyme